jgi:predicted nucleic acid-binding protein
VEPGSNKVEQLVNAPATVCTVSWLTILETRSAFAMKVRTGEIDESGFDMVRRKLNADIAARRWPVVRVLRRHFTRAEHLIADYGMKRRLRSLDALHLGIALDLQSQGGIEAIVTADAVLVDVASREGLLVENPLAP